MSDHHKETSGASQRPINWRAFCHLDSIDFRGYPVLARIYSLVLVLAAGALLALTLFSFTLNIWYGVYCLLVVAPLGMLLVAWGLSRMHTSSLGILTHINQVATDHTPNNRSNI